MIQPEIDPNYFDWDFGEALRWHAYNVDSLFLAQISKS
jgi:hypothetical protein